MGKFRDYFSRQLLLTEMSQIFKEIPKDILSKLLDDKILTSKCSSVFHKTEFSYFFPSNTNIVIFLTNKTDVIRGAYFELFPDKVDNKIVYEEQITTTFQEFYGNSNHLMFKIYSFLKELLNCSILSDEKHSEDSIRQWMKWKDKYNLKVYDAETEQIIEYRDEYFSKNKLSRRYRFLWN